MNLTTIAAYAGGITTIIGLLAIVCKPVGKWFGKHYTKNDPVLQAVKDLRAEVDKIGKKVDENEKDRLKDEIFRFGNIARSGKRITSEEFRNLQKNFQKYTDLGGNDIAHDEYNFIMKYYNEMGWRINGND